MAYGQLLMMILVYNHYFCNNEQLCKLSLIHQAPARHQLIKKAHFQIAIYHEKEFL